jgi:hypothetical protein
MMVMVVIIVLMSNSYDDDGDYNNSDYRPVWTIVDDDKEMTNTGKNKLSCIITSLS